MKFIILLVVTAVIFSNRIVYSLCSSGSCNSLTGQNQDKFTLSLADDFSNQLCPKMQVQHQQPIKCMKKFILYIEESGSSLSFLTGFPSRSFDILTFDAVINPVYQVLVNRVGDRFLSQVSIQQIEKIFQPQQMYDLGIKHQFNMTVEKFQLVNCLPDYSIHIIDIKTDSPSIDLLRSQWTGWYLEPDDRVVVTFHFIGILRGSFEGSIYFQVQFVKKGPHDPSLDIKRTLVYRVSGFVQENDFHLKPLIKKHHPVNEIKAFNIQIYNPSKFSLDVLEITSLFQKVLLKNIEDDQNDESYWEIPTKAQMDISSIILKTNSTGIIRDTIRIKLRQQTGDGSKEVCFYVPMVVQINEDGFNFFDTSVNMGVLTIPNFSDHEYVVQAFNTLNLPIEIVDIKFVVSPPYPCVQIKMLQEKKLAPKSNIQDLLKINIFAIDEIETKSYRAQLIVTTRQRNEEIHSVLNIGFSGFTNLISFSPTDLSIYFNPQDIENDIQPIDTNYQKASRYMVNSQQEIFQIEKDLHIKNNFSIPIWITNLQTYSEILYLSFSGNSSQLQPAKRQQFLSIKLKYTIGSNVNSNALTYIMMEVNHQFFIFLPLIVFDKRLECKTSTSVLQRCNNNLIVDFFNVALNEQRKETLYIRNPNPVAIELTISQPELSQNPIRIVFEEAWNARGPVEKKFILRALGKDQRKRMAIKLEPRGMLIALAVFLNAEYIEENRKYLVFQTPYESFDIQTHYNVIGGNLRVLPWELRFDQSFPGKKSRLNLFFKSNYPVPFKVIDAQTHDNRFIIDLVNTTLVPGFKTEVASITFDASLSSETYVSQQEVPFGVVTYEDMINYSKQMEIWSQMVENSQTSIKTKITFQTEVVQNVDVNMSVILVLPNLVKEESIVCSGLEQYVYKSLTIYNPSDLPVKVQLFLGASNVTSPLYLENVVNEFQQQGSSEIQICVPMSSLIKIQGFLESIQFIFQNQQKEFDISWVEGEIYEVIEKNYRVLRDIKYFHSTFLAETIEKLELHRYFHCRRGQVPQSIKRVYETHRIQNTLFDIAEERVDPIVYKDWIKLFTKLHREFIEIRDISYFSQRTFSSSQQEFIVSKTFLGKLHHLVRKLKIYVQGQEQQLFNNKLTQFYLAPEVQNNQYLIQPHSNITVPALIYRPGKPNDATLIVKNNLTTMQFVQLLGNEGIAVLSLSNSPNREDYGKEVSTFIHIQIQEQSIIEISENKFYVRFEPHLYLINRGKLKAKFESPRINNQECSIKGIEYQECMPFVINSEEIKPITMLIDTKLEDLEIINLSFYSQSQNYYVNFKLSFILPDKYNVNLTKNQKRNSDDYLGFGLLLLSLSFLFWQLRDIFNPKKIPINNLSYYSYQYELNSYQYRKPEVESPLENQIEQRKIKKKQNKAEKNNFPDENVQENEEQQKQVEQKQVEQKQVEQKQVEPQQVEPQQVEPQQVEPKQVEPIQVEQKDETSSNKSMVSNQNSGQRTKKNKKHYKKTKVPQINILVDDQFAEVQKPKPVKISKKKKNQQAFNEVKEEQQPEPHEDKIPFHEDKSEPVEQNVQEEISFTESEIKGEIIKSLEDSVQVLKDQFEQDQNDDDNARLRQLSQESQSDNSFSSGESLKEEEKEQNSQRFYSIPTTPIEKEESDNHEKKNQYNLFQKVPQRKAPLASYQKQEEQESDNDFYKVPHKLPEIISFENSEENDKQEIEKPQEKVEITKKEQNFESDSEFQQRKALLRQPEYKPFEDSWGDVQYDKFTSRSFENTWGQQRYFYNSYEPTQNTGSFETAPILEYPDQQLYQPRRYQQQIPPPPGQTLPPGQAPPQLNLQTQHFLQDQYNFILQYQKQQQQQSQQTLVQWHLNSLKNLNRPSHYMQVLNDAYKHSRPPGFDLNNK